MNESADEESVTPAVRELYEELLRAWNRRDAHAYAALFTPDAAMIGFDGSQVRGSEVEGHLAPIFADHPTAAYVWKVREVRPWAAPRRCCAPSRGWCRRDSPS